MVGFPKFGPATHIFIQQLWEDGSTLQPVTFPMHVMKPLGATMADQVSFIQAR